jgi:hypothetical protein
MAALSPSAALAGAATRGGSKPAMHQNRRSSSRVIPLQRSRVIPLQRSDRATGLLLIERPPRLREPSRFADHQPPQLHDPRLYPRARGTRASGLHGQIQGEVGLNSPTVTLGR